MTCQITAKVLRHSRGADAPPLVTFQLRYPRIIHSELMTHRVFSRNARSSRAVPVPRMIEEIMDDPFIPRYWGANQKGMQAAGECNTLVACYPLADGRVEFDERPREEAWLLARDYAVSAARGFHEAGYHKQIVNRLLEPFMHIDVLVTSTELTNWFALRDDPAAEPHIRDLAREMKAALASAGEPAWVMPGSWHTPYVDESDQADIGRIWDYALANDLDLPRTAVKVSVTRCARISYRPFHGESGDVAAEIERHDALVNARPMHASPAEHQATPDIRLPDDTWAKAHLHGNLTGWVQYRKTLTGESA